MTPSDALIVSGGQAALTHAFRALAAPGDPGARRDADLSGRAGGGPGGGAAGDGRAHRPGRGTARPARRGVRRHRGAGLLLPAHLAQPHRRDAHPGTPASRCSTVARAAGAFVIEDDYARYLTRAGAAAAGVALDAHGTVVHINSLTKVLSPSMRVAGVVARGPAAHRLRASQLVESFFVARPLQETVLEFVGSPAWRRHLADAVHRARRPAATRSPPRWPRSCPPPSSTCLPKGGLHLWVRLPPEVDEKALVEAAGHARRPGQPRPDLLPGGTAGAPHPGHPHRGREPRRAGGGRAAAGSGAGEHLVVLHGPLPVDQERVVLGGRRPPRPDRPPRTP